ncbi:MAG TPA: hypothetical protein VM513_11000 [Kofleriaceae bacterium]|nr:hypothetical protein [Kofleriaceae bacterium]
MHKWLTLALVLGLTACRGKTENAPTAQAPAGSGSAAAADPWKAVDAAPPLDPKTRAEQAIARLEKIQPKLAELRELPLAKAVPAEYQTTDDFRAFMRKGLATELPPEKATKMAAAMHHLGLFKELIDLPAVLEQTMATQAAAYYDPATKKFFVVMVPDSDMMLDTISAHELTHALQDAHFDLTKYLPPTLDDDAGIARRFIAEGDATFAMFAYMATSSAGPSALPKMLELLGGQLEAMASQSTAGYAEMMKQQAAMMPGIDAELKKSMESIDDLPPMVIGPLIDSYLKGALVAMTAYKAGGWKGVDALYKKPPTSTEQVLHPATKLIPKREEPRSVTLPKLEGMELVANVIGELQWAIYFQQWEIKQPEAAVGWGGDRYAVLKDKEGKLVGYLATTWDTPKDAEEFETAYRASVAARFPTGARPDGTKVFVKRAGNHVFIVDGATDPAAVDRLAKGTKIK